MRLGVAEKGASRAFGEASALLGRAEDELAQADLPSATVAALTLEIEAIRQDLEHLVGLYEDRPGAGDSWRVLSITRGDSRELGGCHGGRLPTRRASFIAPGHVGAHPRTKASGVQGQLPSTNRGHRHPGPLEKQPQSYIPSPENRTPQWSIDGGVEHLTSPSRRGFNP